MSAQTSSPLHGRTIMKGFYEKRTGSVQYLVADPETKKRVAEPRRPLA
ncbi:hypothetical protein [Microvirga sp. Mcv34]|nr:hypothetical protein [Microvirga sp. Mcv34]